MSTYLDEIVCAHRKAASAQDLALGELVERAQGTARVRPFAEALAEPSGVSIIAEIKRRSPSRGPIDTGLDPAGVAQSYEAGGAACLSVLTERDSFGGSNQDLVAARGACGLPVLRKDFTVCPADVCDARIMGADAVLLIVAALSQAELAELAGWAERLGLAALVEVHDEVELERALSVGARVVGVNQRDLHTFAVESDRALRLRPLIPEGVLSVAESGIVTGRDIRRLADAGYDAALVGESLLRAPDRAAAVSCLREAGLRCS